MQISCSTSSTNTSASSSSSSTKKKPYKSALREEMAKTFSKFIVQEREQKVSGESKAKPLFVTTPLTAVCPPSNIFQTGLAQDTPHSAKTIGSFNQTIFETTLSSPTPKQQTEINSFQYVTFSEDDDEYAKPIDDLNSFIQTYLSTIIDDDEEYDDGDGFSLITSKPKPLKTNFDLDSTTTTTSTTTDYSFDDEPPTPKTKPNAATFGGGGFGFDFTSMPPKNSFSFTDEVEPLKKPHSFTTTSKAPKKASVDLFAKPIQYDRLDDEFQSLKKFETRLQRKSGMHTSAYRQHNLTKNRYKNILPNENTRVLLQSKDRCEPGSDYINANHIITQTTQNFKHIKLSPPPTYIATQAPLPCTFADFWRMIVEHNSTIIVMLSNEVLSSDSESDENNIADQFDQCFNKNKVNKYWPSLYEKKLFGDIEVETISEEHTSYDFIYRQFLLFGNGLPVSGKIVHFYQYTGWPDMGVPDSTVSFFKLIECIDNLMAQPDYPNGPITIHCSAGVGRTGTFCTIHILLSQYKEYLGLPKEERDNDNPFDFNIYKIVKQLKNLRVGMVQRKEQYRYCYYAARDGIKEIHKIQ